MTEFINKFKMPTILGLSVILLGLASGLYLVLREQIWLSRAAPDLTPQNIYLTNITDNSVVISWQTNTPVASFITFGQNSPGEQTVLDDRDTEGPKPHLTHYVTVRNLLAKTSYQFKIISGKLTSEVKTFDTAAEIVNQTGFPPVVGSVLDGNKPLDDGIAYLSISGAATESALIKTGGNFLIPLSYIRKADLSDIYPLTDTTTAKIAIVSDTESSNLLFKPKINPSPLAPIKLGQDLDLTIVAASPSSALAMLNLESYDPNADGIINAADYAIIFSCSSARQEISCAKADINKDGKIDQKDLDLMTQKLKEFNAQ